MLGSAMYGVLLAAAFFALTRLAPQPAGSLVLWLLLAGQLSRGAAITWRRTRLPFAMAAMLTGAGAFAILAVATVLGHVFPLLPVGWAVAVYGLIVAGAVCLLIESRVHRRKWSQWKSFMEHKSAWDILLGRHIPDLERATGRSEYGG
jgi:hypothetical protein